MGEVPVVSGPAPKPREIPSEVKVKLRVDEGMNVGEYFVHLLKDSFEVTFNAALSTQALKDYLEEKEDFYDAREMLSLQGLGEATVEEELKKLPWPFSSGEEIKLVWTAEDIDFSATAKQWWEDFNKVYLRPELEAFDFERLKTIAKLKGVRVGKGKAETVASILGEAIPAVTAAPPPTPAAKPLEKKGLTAADISKLQDIYSDRLFRELGRVPTNSLATFRVEIEKVKDKTFSEAEEYILGIADDIIGAFIAREGIEKAPTRRVEVYRPPPEEGEGFIPVRGGISAIPPEPKSRLSFPRAPSSEEQAIFWEHFQDALDQMGKSYLDFRTVFAERMVLPYRSWEAILKSYNELLSDIEAGRTVTWISIAQRIAMPWREDTEENWRSDAICHLTSTQLYKTIDELIYSRSPEGCPGLESYGVPNVTPEEVKTVIKKAWKERSPWFITISKQWLEAFIGEPLEQKQGAQL